MKCGTLRCVHTNKSKYHVNVASFSPLTQVRKFCPNTPIILVGCKNDVRFMLNDETYLQYCRERSPLVRQVKENDLLMPDQGRAVAKDLGLPYYEASVLTYFGVNEVFENAIRAALCVRRQQR